MILTGIQIKEECYKSRIKISPFNEEHITTNSFDLTLGDTLLKYENQLIDAKLPQDFQEIKIDKNGYQMNSGDFLLGHSNEKLGSDHFVPIIHGRSSVARLGLFVHVTADLIDIGWHGQVTFQFYSTLPVKLYPGMRIGQVTFWKPKGEIILYKGKYQNSEGPNSSQIYKDF